LNIRQSGNRTDLQACLKALPVIAAADEISGVCDAQYEHHPMVLRRHVAQTLMTDRRMEERSAQLSARAKVSLVWERNAASKSKPHDYSEPARIYMKSRRRGFWDQRGWYFQSTTTLANAELSGISPQAASELETLV
jgi:murein L,D-transpeptidase YcbB/YkuD